MKKFNKGIVITSTVAAAIAALSLAGCGSNANEIAPKAVPANANAVQAVKNDEIAQPVKAEVAEENTAETTAAKKDSKKKSKKKKSKKNAEKNTETQQNVQHVVVVPVEVQPIAQVQPAQPTAVTPANTQAPPQSFPQTFTPYGWRATFMPAATTSRPRAEA